MVGGLALVKSYARRAWRRAVVAAAHEGNHDARERLGRCGALEKGRVGSGRDRGLRYRAGLGPGLGLSRGCAWCRKGGWVSNCGGRKSLHHGKGVCTTERAAEVGASARRSTRRLEVRREARTRRQARYTGYMGYMVYMGYRGYMGMEWRCAECARVLGGRGERCEGGGCGLRVGEPATQSKLLGRDVRRV